MGKKHPVSEQAADHHALGEKRAAHHPVAPVHRFGTRRRGSSYAHTGKRGFAAQWPGAVSARFTTALRPDRSDDALAAQPRALTFVQPQQLVQHLIGVATQLQPRPVSAAGGGAELGRDGGDF